MHRIYQLLQNKLGSPYDASPQDKMVIDTGKTSKTQDEVKLVGNINNNL